MSRKHLRPINETRGPRGQFTSETGARLLRRRGGLARSRQMALEGYATLHDARPKAILARRLNAKMRRECKTCAQFRAVVLLLLSQVYPQAYEQLSPEDARLVG